MSEGALSGKDQRLARVIGLYLFGGVLLAIFFAGTGFISLGEIGFSQSENLILLVLKLMCLPGLITGFILSIRLALKDAGNWALLLLPSLLLPVACLGFYFFVLARYIL